MHRDAHADNAGLDAVRLRAAGNQRPTTEVARCLVGRAREHAFKSPVRLLLGLTFTQALRVAQGVEKRAAGHRQTKAFQNRREARHRLEVIGRAVEKLASEDAIKFLQPLVDANLRRSEEHTSELQSLMRISYAVFCLKKKICTQKARARL